MGTWVIGGAFAPGRAVILTADFFFTPAGNLFLHAAAVETRAQLIARASYTLGNLYLRVTANTRSDSVIFRSRVGAGNGNLTVTVTTTATGVFQDTVNTDSLVDGSLFNAMADQAGGTGTLTFTIFGFTLEDASGDAPILASSSDQGDGPGNVTRFVPPAGGIRIGGTESVLGYTFRVASTLSNMRFFLRFNVLTGTLVVQPRINVTNGNQTVTVAGGGTGAFEDTTNTDSVAAGAEVNYSLVAGLPAGGGAYGLTTMQMKSSSTGLQVLSAAAAGTLSFASDQYVPAQGDSNITTTEASTQIAARVAREAASLFVSVEAHGASNGVDVFLRVNTANSALTLNVPSATTGIFEDTTNQVSLVSGDVYGFFYDHAGGAGSCDIRMVGFGESSSSVAPLTAAGYSPDIFDFLSDEQEPDFGPQGELYYWAFLLERPGAGEPIPTQPTTPTIGARLSEPTRR